MADSSSDSKFDKYSKENRWYYKDLVGHLDPQSRKLLEEYSHIPAEDVDSHIYKIVASLLVPFHLPYHSSRYPISPTDQLTLLQRDILWSHAPYPCVGEFRFLTPNLPRHPKHRQLLSLLQPSPPSPGPYLLDLGCCVAQELRYLSHAGIPSENLYGTDLIPSYLTTSYELFNDKMSFRGTLVPANIFSDTLFQTKFKGWESKFKVVHAGLFLHLFNRPRQLVVCEKIVKLLSGQKGAMFLGEMVGCQGGGERREVKFGKDLEERKQFLHDEESFAELWEEVAEMTGTKGLWKVESRFKSRGMEARSKGCAFFAGEGIGWIEFSAERI